MKFTKIFHHQNNPVYSSQFTPKFFNALNMSKIAHVVLVLQTCPLLLLFFGNVWQLKSIFTEQSNWILTCSTNFLSYTMLWV